MGRRCPRFSSWIATLFQSWVAILGTTISPYLFFWQANHEIEDEIAKGKTTMAEAEGRQRRRPEVHGLGRQRRRCCCRTS